MIKEIIDNNRIIWQIHLSGGDIIVIEERDNKEVFFNAYDIKNDKFIFKDLQFEEKSWIGIEQIYYDKIIFHWYQTPEMPYHKGLMVYDVYNQKILWKNEYENFLFIKDGKVFTSFSKMLGNEIKSYNIETGEIIENFGIDNQDIENIKYQDTKSYLYENYNYPLYYDEIEKVSTKDFINDLATKYNAILSESEVIENEKYLIAGLQIKNGNKFINKILVTDNSTKQIIKEIEANNSEKIIKSCFFVMGKYLFVIKNKNILLRVNL